MGVAARSELKGVRDRGLLLRGTEAIPSMLLFIVFVASCQRSEPTERSKRDSGARSASLPAATTSASAIPDSGKLKDAQAEEVIRRTFGLFQGAIAHRQPMIAAAQVDSRTFVVLESIRDHALNADRAALSRLDLFQQILVLRIRHEFDAARIRSSRGHEIFALAVELDWLANDIDYSIVGELKFEGDRARSVASQAYPDMPWVLPDFVLEHGEWKVQLWSAMPVASRRLRWAFTANPSSEISLVDVLRYVESTTRLGTPIDPKILDGPLPRQRNEKEPSL